MKKHDKSHAIEGCTEVISDKFVRGWAYDPLEPHRRQEVRIFVDDKLVSTVTANEYREELKSKGKGDGCCQFSFDLPTTIKSRNIYCRHAKTNEVLKIAGRAARPEHEKFRHSFVYGSPAIETAVSQSSSTKNNIIAERIIANYYDTFRGDGEYEYSAMWSKITNDYHRDFIECIKARNASSISKYISDLHDTDVVHGISQGKNVSTRVEKNPNLRQKLTNIYFDKLVSVAEQIGALRFEDPVKFGRWGENIYTDPVELIKLIEQEVEFDVLPQNPSGGLFGIKVCNSVLDARMIEAIYVGHRFNQIVGTTPGFICEIGAGLGWCAYYAMKAGIQEYTIYDLPIMNVLQSITLLKTLNEDQVVLNNETIPAHGRPFVRIRNAEDFSSDMFRDGQIFFNQDSFPEIGRSHVANYLENISQVPNAMLLSINQECEGRSGPNETQLVVRDEVKNTQKFHQTLRAPYWPRPGYVEEIFIVN